MEDYFPTSEPSSACIQQPFIAELNDNEQLNLHEQLDTYRFRRPGAQHRAHWMSLAIDALKMLLAQTQLDGNVKILKGLELFDYLLLSFMQSTGSKPL